MGRVRRRIELLTNPPRHRNRAPSNSAARSSAARKPSPRTSSVVGRSGRGCVRSARSSSVRRQPPGHQQGSGNPRVKPRPKRSPGRRSGSPCALVRERARQDVERAAPGGSRCREVAAGMRGVEHGRYPRTAGFVGRPEHHVDVVVDDVPDHVLDVHATHGACSVAGRSAPVMAVLLFLVDWFRWLRTMVPSQS
jgi:hypothetical protein